MDGQLRARRFFPYSKPLQTSRRVPIRYGNPFKYSIMILNHVQLTKERNNTHGVSNACEGIIQALVPISGIHVFTTPCYNGARCTHGATCTHKHKEYPTGSHLVTDKNLLQLINETLWYTLLNVEYPGDAFSHLASEFERLKVLLYPPADAPVTCAINTMSVASAPVFPPTLPKLTDADLERVSYGVTCSVHPE